MALEITPETLNFALELRKQIRSDLYLHNKSSEAVAFKVKTTAPKKYSVKPNTGIVPPGKSIEVQVHMTAQKEVPVDVQSCKDKFLVQSVATTVSDASGVTSEMFSKTNGKEVFENKLRVVYSTPAPPPTVAEEPESPDGVVGTLDKASKSGESLQTKYERAVSDAAAATAQYNASKSEVARLQREVQDLAVAAQKGIGAKGGSVAVDAKPSGFSLLHLLIVALLCFFIGRYM